jgi:hypothetical protein
VVNKSLTGRRVPTTIRTEQFPTGETKGLSFLIYRMLIKWRHHAMLRQQLRRYKMVEFVLEILCLHVMDTSLVFVSSHLESFLLLKYALPFGLIPDYSHSISSLNRPAQIQSHVSPANGLP